MCIGQSEILRLKECLINTIKLIMLYFSWGLDTLTACSSSAKAKKLIRLVYTVTNTVSVWGLCLGVNNFWTSVYEIVFAKLSSSWPVPVKSNLN